MTFGAFSQGDTSSCTFQLAVTWGDGQSHTYKYPGGDDGAKLATFTHSYVKSQAYTISATGSTLTGGCTNASATLQFTLTACSTVELSGPSWAAKFPNSRSLSGLSGKFRTEVTDFIAAMGKADIKVSVVTTLRPAERAYLMHYSWLIAKGKVSPKGVPNFVPGKGQSAVDICWVHTDSAGPDVAASVAVAKRMVKAYGIDPKLKVAPALNSLHTQGLAIDMTTTWSKSKITIQDHSGKRVIIGTTPHSGLNKKLIAVGKTYGVIHFLRASKDPNHWSVNGH